MRRTNLIQTSDLLLNTRKLQKKYSQCSGSFYSDRVRRFAHACIARSAWRARVRFMFEARFQSFDDSSERAQSAPRVAELRSELKRHGLDGFVVPRADRQQNEYLPASEERLAWLTGFTGSTCSMEKILPSTCVLA